MDTGLWVIEYDNGKFLSRNKEGIFEDIEIKLPYSLGDTQYNLLFSTEEKERVLELHRDAGFIFKIFPKMVYVNKNSTICFCDKEI